MKSKQMESDATPPSPDNSVSFKIILEVTQVDDHVANEDANDDENQRQVMGDARDSIALGRDQRNPCKPVNLVQT